MGVGGITLLGGAVAIVGERNAYSGVLRRIPMTRDAVDFFAAATLAVEIVLAVLLLVGREVRVTALASALLFVVFLGATQYLRGADCGCGPFVPKGVRRIVLLAVMGASLIAVSVYNPAVNRSDRALAAATWAVCVVALRSLRANRSALETLSYLEEQSRAELGPAYRL